MALFRSTFAVKTMSAVLEVSRSGFYDWLRRTESKRAIDDRKLLKEIWQIFLESGKRYGRPKIYNTLLARGYRIGEERVRKLMKKAEIRPIIRKKFKVRTTDSNHSLPISENLLGRNFVVNQPNRVWVSDITYIRTRSGWLYLCVIIDLFSRRVVGWSLRPHMKATLVCEALGMALRLRSVEPGNLIFHSDRGSQYASHKFRRLLDENKFTSSMSRKGDCYDNAVAESFFGILKLELVYTMQFENQLDARRELFRYIEGFYNRRRIHSHLDYVSPEQFELSRMAA